MAALVIAALVNERLPWGVRYPKADDCEPVTTRIAQCSWARPGWVGSCGMLACPSAQDCLQDFAKTSGRILGGRRKFASLALRGVARVVGIACVARDSLRCLCCAL